MSRFDWQPSPIASTNNKNLDRNFGRASVGNFNARNFSHGSSLIRPLGALCLVLGISISFLANSASGNETNQKETGKALSKPNIVFIIADDCTFRELGCYGGQAFTPNIDKLATEGMKFNRCFQAAPMCSPTRHNIYTGLYPVKSGAYPNHTFAKQGTKSVCHYLKKLGYRVALSGKTHISPRTIFPFEYSKKGNNPDIETIDQFMSDCKDSKTPFCLFACSNEPHSPWNKGDASRYPADKVKLPSYFVDTPQQRKAFSSYLAEVTYFDKQVGQILDLLKKHNQDDNTLVMVTSEQGNSFPFAKWTLYDSGLQSAMVVRWPGKVKPATETNAMIEYVDVLPTMIEAAGGESPDSLDGKSFQQVLLGKTDSHKKNVFGIMTTVGIINGSKHYGIRSIRSEKYKLIWNLTPEVKFQNACTTSPSFKSWIEKAKSGDQDAADKVKRYTQRPKFELYDVSADPLEWKNLSGDPQFADTINSLKTKLDAWMDEQGDLGQQTELSAKSHQARWARKPKSNNKKNGNKKNGNNKNGQKKKPKNN